MIWTYLTGFLLLVSLGLLWYTTNYAFDQVVSTLESAYPYYMIGDGYTFLKAVMAYWPLVILIGVLIYVAVNSQKPERGMI